MSKYKTLSYYYEVKYVSGEWQILKRIKNQKHPEIISVAATLEDLLKFSIDPHTGKHFKLILE